MRRAGSLIKGKGITPFSFMVLPALLAGTSAFGLPRGLGPTPAGKVGIQYYCIPHVREIA